MSRDDAPSTEHKKVFWNRPLVRGVMIGAGSMLLASVIIFVATKVYSKGELVLTHNDIDVKASEISALVKVHADSLEKFQRTMDTAVQELERVRRDSLAKKLTGKVSREIGGSRQGENRIYVNTNSDARIFKFDEVVEIKGLEKTIRAVVKGEITNPNQNILCKMNGDTAEELGVSKKAGIAEVTISRLLAETLDEHLGRLHR